MKKIKGWRYLREFSPNDTTTLISYKSLEHKNEVKLIEDEYKYMILVYTREKNDQR